MLNNMDQPIFYVMTKLPITLPITMFFHKRTKHVEMDCYFVRERVESKSIQSYVNTTLQLVDLFTKAWVHNDYVLCWTSWSLYSSLRESIEIDILFFSLISFPYFLPSLQLIDDVFVFDFALYKYQDFICFLGGNEINKLFCYYIILIVINYEIAQMQFKNMITE